MKSLKLFSGAALAVGLFSTSAFAYTEQPTPWPQVARPDVPVVAKVVSPAGLPQRTEGQTVNVAFTVDASGQPRNIRLMGAADPDLAKSLIPALSQWRFTPVQKNGVPVSTRVVMPLKLIAGA
jgi:TonB family protein